MVGLAQEGFEAIKEGGNVMPVKRTGFILLGPFPGYLCQPVGPLCGGGLYR